MKYFLLIVRTGFVFSLAIFIGTYFYNSQLVGIPDGPSDKSSASPTQVTIEDSYDINFIRGDYTYKAKPLYNYEITGVVVKRTDFSLLNTNPDSAIQFDFCMVWGDNLKNDLYLKDDVTYTQFERSCYYHFPVKNSFVKEQFSNNRLIIDDSNELLQKARAVNVGDEVVVKGRLVDLIAYKKTDTTDSVLDWKTSTNRNDEGKDGNELIYVDSIEVISHAHYREAVLNRFTYQSTIITAGMLVVHFVGILIFLVPGTRKAN